MSPRPKTMAKQTAARVPTTEYVCRRSLSSELRPYPGYSPIKERNPIHTATAKTPTTIAVDLGYPSHPIEFHWPKRRCSSKAASQTSTASKASDNNKTRTTPGCLQARARRRLAALPAAMGALLPVEQYYRYWELDSSSTPSPPQPTMMGLIRSRIQRQIANLPENQGSHHRLQTDRLRSGCSAVLLSIPPPDLWRSYHYQ